MEHVQSKRARRCYVCLTIKHTLGANGRSIRKDDLITSDVKLQRKVPYLVILLQKKIFSKKKVYNLVY